MTNRRICLSLEQLEDRCVPTATTITGSSPIPLDAGTVHQGDKISFKIDNWIVTDPSDPTEGENLVVESNGGLSRTISQLQSAQITYVAQANGETFDAYIINGDFDESVNVTVATPGVDLQLTLDSSKIVPTQATNLNLNTFYGTESVQLPFKLENDGQDPAKGQVTLDVFLSTTPDLNGSVTGTKPFSSTMYTINLASFASQDLNAKVTIDPHLAQQLTLGSKYYFIGKVSSPTIRESDDNNGTDQNNIAASSTNYEYLGTPGRPNVFAAGGKYGGGKYFDIVQDTIQHVVNPFANQGAPTPTDGQHFTAAFESPGGFDNPNLAPYLDSKGIPTIGIGLNLTALNPNDPFDAVTINILATDVRAYYKAQPVVHGGFRYTNIDSLSDSDVIAMLEAQAKAGGAPKALKKTDAQALFNRVYLKHQQAAMAAVGATVWATLPAGVQWVLTDIDFNAGGGVSAFTNLLKDLKAPGGPDYLRAGFDFLDSKRADTDVGYDRSLAGFEYILGDNYPALGRIVGA